MVGKGIKWSGRSQLDFVCACVYSGVLVCSTPADLEDGRGAVFLQLLVVHLEPPYQVLHHTL